MKNVLSTTLPLIIEMLLDLVGLNCIHAHSMLLISLPNNRLVQATVVVMIVMSSMYALIGGSRIPEAKRSPPTTHFDALIITSIAMVKASGEMMHPAIIPVYRHCHVVVNSEVEKQNCKSPKYAFTKFIIVLSTLKKSNAAQRSSCGIEPYALTKSRNVTWSSFLSFLAV